VTERLMYCLMYCLMYYLVCYWMFYWRIYQVAVLVARPARCELP